MFHVACEVGTLCDSVTSHGLLLHLQTNRIELGRHFTCPDHAKCQTSRWLILFVGVDSISMPRCVEVTFFGFKIQRVDRSSAQPFGS